MKTARNVLAIVSLCAAIAPAWAQLVPGKLVRIVVPYPAGGAVDASIRVVAERLAQELGRTVIVENRAGANGNIGASAVASATADGHTLLASSNFLAFNPALDPPPRWKPEDFVPVARVALMHNFVAVPMSEPAKTLAEFVAQAKANPELPVATGGPGNSQTHALDLLQSVAGIRLNYVVYAGGPPSIPDLVSGLTKMGVVPYSLARPLVAGSKLRALAVTSAERSTHMPEIPTTAEAGYPGVVSVSWYGIHAPRGTPAATLKVLEGAVLASLKSANVQSQLNAVGAEPAALEAEPFGKFVRAEERRGAAVHRTSEARAGN